MPNNRLEHDKYIPGRFNILGKRGIRRASKTANEIQEFFGGRAVPFKADVREKGDILSVVKWAMKEFGKMDIFCNNEGICTSPPVEEHLRTQKRFKHLFTSDEGGKVVEEIQALAGENINRFGLQKDE